MRQNFGKWFNMFSDRTQRYYIVTVISCALVFLIPYVGWSPILFLWVIHAFMSYKELPRSKVRFLYAGFGLVFLVILVIGLGVRGYIILRYNIY